MAGKSNGNYDLAGEDIDDYKRQRTYLLMAIGCLGAITIGLFVGLLLAGSKVHPEEEAFCLTSACTLSAAELLHAFNQSQDPCQDFFQFVCGNEELPEGSLRENDQFSRLTYKIHDLMRPLLYSTDPTTVPEAVQKAIKLMRVCDQFTNLTDPRNLKILKEFVHEFGGWPLATPGKWDPRREVPLPLLVSTIVRMGYELNIFMFSLMTDEKQLDKFRITLGQPSPTAMGIIAKRRQSVDKLTPEEEAQTMNIRYLATLLGNNDTQSIDTAIDEIFKLKKDLVEIFVPRSDINDDLGLYNKMTIRDLHNITDNKIDWLKIIQEIFKGYVEIEDSEEVIVREVQYLKRLPAVLEKYNERVIANYMIMHVLLNLKDEVNTLYTTPELRMPFCYSWTNEEMYLATSRLYLENYFNKENKKWIHLLVEDIKDAYRDTIQNTKLMDEETKNTAMKKLDNLTEVIGYPEWILNDEELNAYYDFLTVTDNHLVNIISYNRNATLSSLGDLREVPDNRSTEVNPTEVNAYYLGSENKIVIPAAILQPPFFDADYTVAKNFGALGSIIGHEIGHGFDAKGRMHDETGMLREWWSEESMKAFENKTECFINQYNQYCPKEYLTDGENDTCIDGNYTLTENMADNSGLRNAFKAYKMATEKYGRRQKLPGLGEFTRDQIFFISFADVWCETIKKGAYSSVYGDDIHAVAKYRVIGSLANFPEFAKAFNCPPGLMNRQEESCSLWT